MTRGRAAGRARRTAAGAVAVAGLALGLAAPAGAAPQDDERVFIDPADVCPVPAPPAAFVDRDAVPAVHGPSVDCARALEITLGRPTGDGRYEYAPGDSIRRDQMASFIVRTWRAAGYELPVAADEPFTDVAPDNAHYENIRILLESGVTRGTTATTYSPADPVTRVQMASFVTRAASFGFSPPGTEASTTDFDPSGTEPADKFVDLPEFTDLQGTTGEQARDVQAAGELLGLTAGTTPTTFSPRQPVTRAQMATFVVRLLDTTLTPDQALEYAAVKGGPSS